MLERMKDEGGRLRARSEPSGQRVFGGHSLPRLWQAAAFLPVASEWVGGAYYKSPRIAKFFATENFLRRKI